MQCISEGSFGPIWCLHQLHSLRQLNHSRAPTLNSRVRSPTEYIFKRNYVEESLFSGLANPQEGCQAQEPQNLNLPLFLGSQQGCREHFLAFLAPPVEEETSPGFIFPWLNTLTTKHLHKRTGNPKTSTSSQVLKGRTD